MTSFNEFKVYWMANTDEPENRTRALFNQFDFNRDGFIGGSQEEAYLFQAFDNFKSKFISFIYSLLLVYSRRCLWVVCFYLRFLLKHEISRLNQPDCIILSLIIA